MSLLFNNVTLISTLLLTYLLTYNPPSEPSNTPSLLYFISLHSYT